jgi:hypothetical protein
MATSGTYDEVEEMLYQNTTYVGYIGAGGKWVTKGRGWHNWAFTGNWSQDGSTVTFAPEDGGGLCVIM